MAEQPNFPRRPATIFNDFKYGMPKSTKPVEGAKWPATWNWEIGTTGKIFFKCNDGIYGRDDPNAKNKEVEMKAFDRNQLLFVLMEAINNPDFESSQVLIRDKLFNNQLRKFNDTPTVTATFTVFRAKNGEIRVNYARGTYEVMFNMTSEYLIMKTKTAEGVVENPGLASRAYVDSFVRFSRTFLNLEEWNRYTRPGKKDGTGNTQTGGARNNNNSTGSTTPPSDIDDEDFDF